MKHFIILLLILTTAAYAKEICVSPSGNDGNAGTEKSPLLSIQKALSQARPGDTVKLMPGIYREAVKITKSGTADSPITITGTRSADGKYLSILESVGLCCTNWQKADEIGENVWKVKVKSRPELIMLDGKMAALINDVNMRLRRRTPIPEKLNDELMMGSFDPKKSKRLSGLDLLAVKDDILVTNRLLKKRQEKFWEAVGYVLCGYHNGYLYIRFANGSSPDKHKITISYGDGISVADAENIIIENLHMRASKIQVHITGKSKNITVRDSLLMHGIFRIKIEKNSSDITVCNNILSCGFIQDKYFGALIDNGVSGRLTYLIFKYIIGAARSADAGIDFAGSRCHIYNNIIFNGLIGIRPGGPEAKVHSNCIYGMSSCGIASGGFSSGEFYENLIMNCGIPLRIHDWRHEKFYRTEYHYRNLFVQPQGGSNLHVYGASNTIPCPDKVNYDKKGIYLENPPAPFDPGKIFIYHNTFAGGGAHAWPMKNYYDRYRKQPMPFYLVNNIIKCSRQWDTRHQHMMAGNLLYIHKSIKAPMPLDKNVGKYNRIIPAEKAADICTALYDTAFPDVRLKENSPALECAVDISKPGKFKNIDVPALPGFAQGYFKGKAPAAGALQQGDDKLMEKFNTLNKKLSESIETVRNLK